MGNQRPTQVKGAQAWCDGACAPVNPGGTGGWGFIIELPEGGEITGYGSMKARPDMTNNVSEFCAVGAAIRRWKDLKRGPDQTLHIHTDSNLVVNIMLGRWKAKEGAYLPVYERLKVLVSDIDFIVTYTWIPRERNQRADALSRKALQELGIVS